MSNWDSAEILEENMTILQIQFHANIPSKATFLSIWIVDYCHIQSVQNVQNLQIVATVQFFWDQWKCERWKKNWRFQLDARVRERGIDGCLIWKDSRHRLWNIFKLKVSSLRDKDFHWETKTCLSNQQNWAGLARWGWWSRENCFQSDIWAKRLCHIWAKSVSANWRD